MGGLVHAPDRGCARARSAVTRIVTGLVLIGAGFHAAHAQQANLQLAQPVAAQPAPPPLEQPAAPPLLPSQGIEVLVTPYLWFPWVSSKVRPSNTRIPSVSATVDPGTLYGHLTWIPFMGSAEFRDGPYGLVLDLIHAPVKTGVNTPVLFGGATTGLTEDAGTAMFLYRPLAQPDQYVDVGLGVRAWGIDGNISLNQGLLPAVSVANGLSWADPLIGVRYHRDLGNGLGATAYGDVGGFGLGAHIDWQLVGTIDYAVNSWINLHGGFRTLNYSFGGDRADFHEHFYGPIISATFRF
jgi:hypothetical protein